MIPRHLPAIRASVRIFPVTKQSQTGRLPCGRDLSPPITAHANVVTISHISIHYFNSAQSRPNVVTISHLSIHTFQLARPIQLTCTNGHPILWMSHYGTIMVPLWTLLTTITVRHHLPLGKMESHTRTTTPPSPRMAHNHPAVRQQFPTIGDADW